MDMSFTNWNRENAPSESDGLEPLGWAALSARLSATHRLRRELTAGVAHPRCGTASFAPHAFDPPASAPEIGNRYPALQKPTSAQSDDPVNLEPLGDRKPGGAMSTEKGEGQPSRECRIRGLQ